MTHGDPFCLDAVQAAVCSEAAVTSEAEVFLEIIAAPVVFISAFSHCYFPCTIKLTTLLTVSISHAGSKIYCTKVADSLTWCNG